MCPLRAQWRAGLNRPVLVRSVTSARLEVLKHFGPRPGLKPISEKCELIPKLTPAEKRHAARKQYEKTSRRTIDMKLDLTRVMLKYIAAINAGFVIGSAGLISKFIDGNGPPSIAVAIFIIGILGIANGLYMLFAVNNLMIAVSRQSREKWHDIIHKFQPYMHDTVDLPEPREGFKERVVRFKQSIDDGTPFAEVIIREKKEIADTSLKASITLSFSVLTVVINMVLAIITVLSL